MPSTADIGRWAHVLRLRVRSLFRRRELERELDDELQFHLEQQTAENVARGMNTADARTNALIALGGFERRKEESRATRRVNWIEDFLRDCRYGLRSLRRTPGFTAIVVLTLALGIGANGAIFTVVNAVLLRPLNYHDASRLVVLQYENESTVSPGTFFDWKEGTTSFKQMALAEYWTPGLTGIDKPQEVVGLHVSANMFELLQVAPLLGRTFSADEGHAGRDHVVVISHEFWQQRMGSDPHVLNQSVTLDGAPYTVIGVMPPGFIFAPFWATQARFWAPAVLDGSRNERDHASFRAFARLGDGVTLDRASGDLNNVNAVLHERFPGPFRRLVAIPLQQKVVGDVRGKLLVLLVAVGLVLLIACANVAHLLLMRAASREREYGVRTALGATRFRLAQQSLIETAMIVTAGSALGMLLAYGGVRALIALGPTGIPRLSEVTVDWRVIAYLLTAALLSATVFGLAPAIRASRSTLGRVIKEAERSGGEGVGGRRARATLVASEFAMALLLLVGAGLVVKSFVALTAVEPGFDASNVVSMVVAVNGTGSERPDLRAQFYRELIHRVNELPGVKSASAINHLPLHGDNWHFHYSVEGRSYEPSRPRPSALFRIVQPGYFETMRIPITQGRDYAESDETTASQLVIVSEYMAKHAWPNENPIGRRITVDDENNSPAWFTVVGVAHDVKQEDLTATSASEMYFPWRENHDPAARAGSAITLLNPSSITLVLRTNGNTAALVMAVQQIVWKMERNAPVSDVITVDQAIREQIATPRFYAMLMSAFGAVALILATVGVYGVISYSVSRRTREMGIRMALGAKSGEAFTLIMSEGMKLAAIGGTVGLLLAFALMRFLNSLLFGVAPTDPTTFASVAAVLGVAAFVACIVPARRASRVDPVTALRSE